MTAAAEPLPVVAAVVRRGGRYLLGRRPESKRHGGLWEFPGGKVRAGESRLDAVRRELAEELSLQVRALGEVVYSAMDTDSAFRIDFVRAQADGEPVALEHVELGWFEPQELRTLALAPADARFAALLAAESS